MITTFDEYQHLAARTINNLLNKDQIERHAIHGMMAELGEINAIFQKWYQGHSINDDDLKEELGDFKWFYNEFCTNRGWSVADIADANIEKLKKRYPQGFESERSVHREEYEKGKKERKERTQRIPTELLKADHGTFVLTYDDMVTGNYKDEWALMLETKDCKHIFRVDVYATLDGFAVYEHGSNDVIEDLEEDDYGKTWRVWVWGNMYPAKQLREMAKWDD